MNPSTLERLKVLETDLKDIVAEVHNIIVQEDAKVWAPNLDYSAKVEDSLKPITPTVTVTQSAADRLGSADPEYKPAKLAAPNSVKPDRPTPTMLSMLDIETLATTDDAVILQVGLVTLDLQYKVIHALNWALDVPSQYSLGRVQSVDTLTWWTEQGADLVKLQNQAGDTLTNALSDIVRNFSSERIEWWAKGDFDFRIMEHAFKQLGIPIPWKYWQLNNLRGAKAVVPSGVYNHITNPNAHDAVSDADYQMQQLIAILEHTGKQDENYI